jgi:hypothetical protein
MYAENFKLISHSLVRTIAGVNKTHIVLPNVETIINPSEQKLLQTQSNSSVHIKEIDDIIRKVVGTKDRAELDITAVLENLRQVEPLSHASALALYYDVTVSSPFRTSSAEILELTLLPPRDVTLSRELPPLLPSTPWRPCLEGAVTSRSSLLVVDPQGEAALSPVLFLNFVWLGTRKISFGSTGLGCG